MSGTRTNVRLVSLGQILPWSSAPHAPLHSVAPYVPMGKDTLGSADEEGLLNHINNIAVKGINTAVHWQEFYGMAQVAEQPIRAFVGQLRSKAAQCDFTTKCTSSRCSQNISYSDIMFSDQMIVGLYDKECQADVLARNQTLKTKNAIGYKRMRRANAPNHVSTPPLYRHTNPQTNRPRNVATFPNKAEGQWINVTTPTLNPGSQQSWRRKFQNFSKTLAPFSRTFFCSAATFLADNIHRNYVFYSSLEVLSV